MPKTKTLPEATKIFQDMRKDNAEAFNKTISRSSADLADHERLQKRCNWVISQLNLWWE